MSHYESEYLSHLWHKLWRILQIEYKQLSSVSESIRGCLTIVLDIYVKDMCNMLDLFKSY